MPFLRAWNMKCFCGSSIGITSWQALGNTARNFRLWNSSNARSMTLAWRYCIYFAFLPQTQHNGFRFIKPFGNRMLIMSQGMKLIGGKITHSKHIKQREKETFEFVYLQADATYEYRLPYLRERKVFDPFVYLVCLLSFPWASANKQADIGDRLCFKWITRSSFNNFSRIAFLRLLYNSECAWLHSEML